MIIYYDSFNRSGSHFFLACASKAFNNVSFIWGMHDIEYLKLKNMTTIIRNPVDSISSFIVMENKQHDTDFINNVCEQNCLWLKTTLELKNYLNIVLFNDLINNTQKVLLDIKKQYNIPEINDVNIKEVVQHFSLEKNYKNSYVPNVEKQKLIDNVKTTVKSMCLDSLNLYEELEGLYAKI